MIKKEKKEIEINHIFCDDCGIDITHNNRRCAICGKDVCNKCVGYYEYDGDYTTNYCKSCWIAGEKYREEIKEYENIISQIEDKIENIHDKWINECKKC